MAFFFYSFSSKAELLTPGETSVEEKVTEHLGEGHIDTVTKTTTIIENRTTGDILDSNTGVVTTKYEGDMDSDWGGQGSASMPSGNSCYGLGTDKCAMITGSGNSTSTMGVSGMGTTFTNTINISDLTIDNEPRIM